MIFRLFAMFALFGLVACSDPKGVVIPEDMSKMDSIRPQLQKLTEDERNLVAAFVMRRSMKGTMLGKMAGDTGTGPVTISQALENQRTFIANKAKEEAEAVALKAKAEAELEAAQKTMREAVTVALLSKKLDIERGYSGIELDRLISMTVAYQNNGAKDVAGVKGRLVIHDLFGDKLSTFAISNDTTIKPGATVSWTGGRSLRRFGENKDEKFLELTEDKYKVTWEPEVVVFSDGTKLVAPQR